MQGYLTPSIVHLRGSTHLVTAGVEKSDWKIALIVRVAVLLGFIYDPKGPTKFGYGFC